MPSLDYRHIQGKFEFTELVQLINLNSDTKIYLDILTFHLFFIFLCLRVCGCYLCIYLLLQCCRCNWPVGCVNKVITKN
jgi:hypothetical protein